MNHNQEIAEKLRDMAVNTGTLNCLGCGFEHNCSVHGCAVLKQAAELISQPNEPLTLEQLREMDGEPVWIANPDALEYGRWGIVDGVYQAEDDQVLMLRGDYSCHYYGKTWLAYRRPPEGENHHG